MPLPLQLPGTRANRSTSSPMLPVVIAAATLALILVAVYVVPLLPVWSTAASTTAISPAVPPPALPAANTTALDRDDLRRHLELSRQEIVRSTEDLYRAERAWTIVSTRLDRNFLQDERRRADAGTSASRDARERLERALDELHVVVDYFK